MDKPFLSPLNYQVRIVDAQGRPTPEFQMKWRKLFQIASTIPDASNAAAMSLLLDLIAADEGDLLRRGATAWSGLSTPGGTSNFLRADGTYAVIPDVSTDTAGLAPKLPGSATKYLDGTGQYTTPAGGSGGGGSAAVYFAATGSNVSSSEHSFKGTTFSPTLNMSLTNVIPSLATQPTKDIQLQLWYGAGGVLTEHIETFSALEFSESGPPYLAHVPLATPAEVGPGALIFALLGYSDGSATPGMPFGSPGEWTQGLPVTADSTDVWVDESSLSVGTAYTLGTSPFSFSFVGVFA